MLLSYTAVEKDAGRKVYSVLRGDLSLSATLVKRLKASGGIYVDGVNVFTDRRLLPGERVEADVSTAERQPDFLPEDGELEILFENEVLIAVNKPCGMLVHPSRSKYMGTLAGIVSGYFMRTCGDASCHPVNRLDRDTSGIVLFAKNAYAKTRTAAALSLPDAKKEYHAFLFGALSPESGTIDLPISRPDAGSMRRCIAEDGQPAVTYYHTVRRCNIGGGTVSELMLTLKTGRTHQIRVHCAALGAPLLGDGLYCTAESQTFSESLGVRSQLLHAEKLEFVEPLSGKLLTISAPIRREDMLKVSDVFNREES